MGVGLTFCRGCYSLGQEIDRVLRTSGTMINVDKTYEEISACD
jgi:hypothetical protein